MGIGHTTIFNWIGLDPNDYEAVNFTGIDGSQTESIKAIVSQNIFPIIPADLNHFIVTQKLDQENHILNNVKDNYKFFLVNMKRVTYLERLRVNTDAQNN